MHWCQRWKDSRNPRRRFFGSSRRPSICEVVQWTSRLQRSAAPKVCRWICCGFGSRKCCFGCSSVTCSFTKRARCHGHGTWRSECNRGMATSRFANSSHRRPSWFCSSSFYQCWASWTSDMFRRCSARGGPRWTGAVSQCSVRRRALQEPNEEKIRGYFREDGSKFRRCWKDQQTCSPPSFLAITSGGLVRRWFRHRNSLSSDAASRWSGTTSRGSILWCCSGYFMWLGCAKCRLWHFALPRTAFEVE